MKYILNYLKGYSFYFEGYKGGKDFERLKGYLIDCASTTDGTQLILAIHDRFPPTKIVSELNFNQCTMSLIIMKPCLNVDYLNVQW